MFQLIILEDKLTCTPDQINRDPSEVFITQSLHDFLDSFSPLYFCHQVIIEQIEIKYVNKVIPNVGLGIAFFDYVSVGEPYLYPAAGSAIRLVVFRLVVFRPFIGEVITGRVTRMSKDGLAVSIDFFDDITISGAQLQNPSTYDPVKNQWTWVYDDGENQTPFVTEVGDQVRFKVRSVSFTSLTHSAKGIMATTTSESSELPRNTEIVGQDGASLPLVRRRSSSTDISNEKDVPSAMQIAGSTNDFGLGVTSWW